MFRWMGVVISWPRMNDMAIITATLTIATGRAKRSRKSLVAMLTRSRTRTTAHGQRNRKRSRRLTLFFNSAPRLFRCGSAQGNYTTIARYPSNAQQNALMIKPRQKDGAPFRCPNGMMREGQARITVNFASSDSFLALARTGYSFLLELSLNLGVFLVNLG